MREQDGLPPNAEPDEQMPASSVKIADALIRPEKRWLPSLVWLVPLVAALIGLSLVINALLSQGPSITLSFSSAEGLEAGKTKVKFKDVDIGIIQSISLSSDRHRIIANVDLSKSASPFAVADSRFWVVRPRASASGISGLSTLLAGAYIGVEAGRSSVTEHNFVGLDVPPVVTADVPGKYFNLHADDLGSLDIGAPIYYRRIQVGQIVGYELDARGEGIVLRIFVKAPYDRYVTENARFWHASGVDIKFDAGGFKINTQSLATLIAGGIAFQSPEDTASGAIVPSNTVFALASDEATAMKAQDGEPETVVVYFKQSVRGLTQGAPVDFRGVVLGEVKSIAVDYDQAHKEFHMPVVLNLYPQRLQSSSDSSGTHQNSHDFFIQLIEQGLRAQLKTGNLLTGQLYVALDFFPKSAKVVINRKQSPLLMPTVPGSLDQLESAVSEILKKVQKVPIDSIGQNLDASLISLNTTLKSTDQLMKKLDGQLAPEAQATLLEARKTMASAGQLLSQDAPLQSDLRDTLRELARSAQSLRVLTDYLERHPESLIQGKDRDDK